MPDLQSVRRETFGYHCRIKPLDMTLSTKTILSCMLLSIFAPAAVAQVDVSETTTVIPTWLVGDPEPDPYFFTGRTYQGAAGHVYPYPIYDILTDERTDREYKYLTLGNEYTEIGVLPEIGGRIFSACDRQTGYDFFYRQHVIRPALIGMIGSWISGGVEWNIPHHHRASSTLNTGYEIVENADGSKTIWIGETELRQRLKWNIGLTIFPGKSYVEARFQIQNRTPVMQSFLYWANVSVHCDENYQVQFPAGTSYGTTHSKTEYSDWPYARKDEDGNPIDDSMWANFTGSNSTFAVNYTNDYLVGYDFGKDAGTAHFANHHVVPGKKFFLWGTESVWNRMLTEEDGAYLELMVGTFSDNQPDYSWIGPNEVRETRQYWYPIKGIGGAKNVTLEGAVNLVRKSPTQIMAGFNATSAYRNAKVIVKAGDSTLLEKIIDIDPDTPFIGEFTIDASLPDTALFAGLYDACGKELVSYAPAPPQDTARPHPADRPKAPEEYGSTEELLLAAQRLEEFHNARVDPLPYYMEVLKRDSLDSRANVNLGIHHIRRGEWEKAEKYLQKAYMRLTGLHYMPDVARTGAIYHTNPKDGEMLYYLGVTSLQLGKEKEAEAYFWKSTWYPGFQSAAYLYLAQLYWRQGKAGQASEAIDKSIELNSRSTLSKFVKSYILSSTGRTDEARAMLKENIAYDPLDFLSRIELARLDNDRAAISGSIRHMGIPLQEIIEICTFYGSMGAYGEALDLLDHTMADCPEYASTPMQKNAVEPFTASPLLNYMAGYYAYLAGDGGRAVEYFRKASLMSPRYCFPSRMEEKAMLEKAIALNPEDGRAYYYLGNLLYYLDRKDEAIDAWTRSTGIDPSYGMAYRNLGFAADKHLSDKAAAAGFYRKAIAADNSDPKFFAELDMIEEALKVPSRQRLARMDKNRNTVLKSDDATSRLVYLYIGNGDYKKALDILETRHFRVWEGGQTVHTMFVDAHLLNGLRLLGRKHAGKALEEFLAAGTFPENLETNELSTGPTAAKVAYHQGLAYKALRLSDKADEAFRRCIDIAGDGTRRSRRAGDADESKYYVAMSQYELGDREGSAETIRSLREYVEGQLAPAGGSTAVDIYSKFGEDGSDDTIRARNIYLLGLVHLAQGDRTRAQECFSHSLELNPSNVWARHYLSQER